MAPTFNFALITILGLFNYSRGGIDSWPEGKYGLLKPRVGCPMGWPQKTGWIYQDTEDTNPSNNRSKVLHIDGTVDASYVFRAFCVKTVSSGTSWPKGQYCVYNKYSSTCQRGSGMELGLIRWDDENTNNQNKLAQPLPYADIYKNNLRLSFCCATNGSKSISIQLPTTTPFYLLPYNSSKCQQVEWMIATKEWITYDKQNTGTDYSEQTGTLPYYTLDRGDITMYYCYYQSCNYTLSTKIGSFQSPGYPDNYTDGQLCSWKIRVPLNDTVLVSFTTFSMETNSNNDSLEYYTKYNGSYELVHRYHGDDIPAVVMSESIDVMFVFRSDNEYNSYGFRADYEIFPTKDFYTTTMASTTVKKRTTPVKTTQLNTEYTPTQQPTIATSSSPLPTNKTSKNVPAKASGSESKSTIILIVIPLVCFVLVVVLIIDIWYRCRYRSYNYRRGDLKIELRPEMAVNDMYDCEMIVSQCSTVTRPTTDGTNGQEMHHGDKDYSEVYQNTNMGFRSDDSPNKKKSPNKPRTTSQENDYYMEPLQCLSEGDPEPFGIVKGVPQPEAEYSNIEPRVVSGEYGYLQPLEYVPRSDSDKTPMKDRGDSDASYLEPLEYVEGVKVLDDVGDVSIDNPIYQYDNVCEPLGTDEDLYASVN